MSELSIEKQKIIDKSKTKLDLYKKNLKEEIYDIEKELEDFELSSSNENDEVITNESMEVLWKKVVYYKEEKIKYTAGLDILVGERDREKQIINFYYNGSNFSSFINLIQPTSGLKIDNVLSDCRQAQKLTGIKPNFTRDDLQHINVCHNANYLQLERLLFKSQENIALNLNKEVQDIKNNIKEVISILDNVIKFFEDVNEKIISMALEVSNSIDVEKKKEEEKRKNERAIRLNELQNRKDQLYSSYNEVESINDAFFLYEISNSHDDLIVLADKLYSANIITKREHKNLIYVKKEKGIEEPVKIKEEVTNEEPIVEAPKELTVDYFKEKDTKNIICFLGNNGDNIIRDLENHFSDNSIAPQIYKELENIFKHLYQNKEYKGQLGGDPGYFSSALVYDQLGYHYLRFGVSKDQFRIHAIYKDSALLKELGYGSGRVVFFGAIGVNDDKKKSKAYERIVSRGIFKHGNIPELQDNFRDIDHIIKSYVPISLLSDNDIERLRQGKFNGKLKGTQIDKSIERLKYIYYYVLDDESKNNVSLFLNKYFLNQTQTMFDIINKYEDKKDNTLV